MGNENSSICTCYDGAGEKTGESDIYQHHNNKKNITKESLEKIKKLELDNNMYSMAFSGTASGFDAYGG